MGAPVANVTISTSSPLSAKYPLSNAYLSGRPIAFAMVPTTSFWPDSPVSAAPSLPAAVPPPWAFDFCPSAFCSSVFCSSVFASPAPVPGVPPLFTPPHPARSAAVNTIDNAVFHVLLFIFLLLFVFSPTVHLLPANPLLTPALCIVPPDSHYPS